MGFFRKECVMSDINAVIVDDSAFSIAFIRDILETNGVNVIGEAGSLEEVKQVIREKRPNLVTMDMTLPGTDGFECTQAIHEIDGSIKVIMVSSMMDEEIVQEAKKNKISAYVQKPVDSEELITAIKRVMAVDELFEFLQAEYVTVFKEALADGLNRMTKTTLTYKEEYVCEHEFESMGMPIIIGIIGKFCGRMLVDISKETAEKITMAIMKKEPQNLDVTMAALAEFANIIAGNASSMLNRQNKALGLRVAPPSILRGDSLCISAPDFSTTSMKAQTEFGEILLNVGFKRSE
jgi:DNA-binding NarL/FixJ family response regulator